MESMCVCPFCEETRFINNKMADLPVRESILFENKNIYVGVDVSPLVRGHILIITKKHYLNFYEIDEQVRQDVLRIKDKIKEVFKRVYHKDVMFFEHGSAKSGEAGSSIDHAHLHCIPYVGEIKDEIEQVVGEGIPCDIFTKNDFKNDFSYLYLEYLEEKILYKVKQLPSQFLRKIVLKKSGYSDYKWQDRCRSKENKKILNATIEDLKNKLSICYL